MAITWLDAHKTGMFPPLEHATEHGLLAAGGDLSPERLLAAYRQGVFPWFNRQDPILWWSPDPRMVLRPEEIRIRKSLRKVIRQGQFTVTMDRAFRKVMLACAAPRRHQFFDPDNSTWIHEPVIDAYQSLHELGYGHSVEVWHQDKLVGGLYGVATGRVFFGESMFSFQSDSSKVALVALSQQLARWDMPLIDCQVYSDHLASMGAIEIPREEFVSELSVLASHNTTAGKWTLDTDLPKV